MVVNGFAGVVCLCLRPKLGGRGRQDSSWSRFVRWPDKTSHRYDLVWSVFHQLSAMCTNKKEWQYERETGFVDLSKSDRRPERCCVSCQQREVQCKNLCAVELLG